MGIIPPCSNLPVFRASEKKKVTSYIGTLEICVEWKEKQSQKWECQELRELILFKE